MAMSSSSATRARAMHILRAATNGVGAIGGWGQTTTCYFVGIDKPLEHFKMKEQQGQPWRMAASAYASDESSGAKTKKKRYEMKVKKGGKLVEIRKWGSNKFLMRLLKPRKEVKKKKSLVKLLLEKLPKVVARKIKWMKKQIKKRTNIVMGVLVVGWLLEYIGHFFTVKDGWELLNNWLDGGDVSEEITAKEAMEDRISMVKEELRSEWNTWVEEADKKILEIINKALPVGVGGGVPPPNEALPVGGGVPPPNEAPTEAAGSSAPKDSI